MTIVLSAVLKSMLSRSSIYPSHAEWRAPLRTEEGEEEGERVLRYSRASRYVWVGWLLSGIQSSNQSESGIAGAPRLHRQVLSS